MALLVLVAMVVGCTSTRTFDVTAPTSFSDQVQVDDRVRIVSVDGRVLAFDVVRVEHDALLGPNVRVEQAEIAELEITRLSPGRTAGLVGGMGVTVLGVAILISIAIAPAILLGA